MEAIIRTEAGWGRDTGHQACTGVGDGHWPPGLHWQFFCCTPFSLASWLQMHRWQPLSPVSSLYLSSRLKGSGSSIPTLLPQGRAHMWAGCASSLSLVSTLHHGHLSPSAYCDLGTAMTRVLCDFLWAHSFHPIDMCLACIHCGEMDTQRH